MVRGFQCSYASAQYFAYVLVLHLLKILHVEDLALFGRQALYCLLQLHLCLVSDEIGVAFQLYSYAFSFVGAGNAYCCMPMPLQELAGLVIGTSI